MDNLPDIIIPEGTHTVICTKCQTKINTSMIPGYVTTCKCKNIRLVKMKYYVELSYPQEKAKQLRKAYKLFEKEKPNIDMSCT
jgi:hypothetical protein